MRDIRLSGYIQREEHYHTTYAQILQQKCIEIEIFGGHVRDRLLVLPLTHVTKH